MVRDVGRGERAECQMPSVKLDVRSPDKIGCTMKRDSILYRLFSQSPTILFDLLPNPPANAGEYRFDSVAVKEPKFEIDGVFLPPDGAPGIVYFCEFQMQKDEKLYERGFAESALYFYRQRDRFCDWQMIFIYPSRQTEQSDLHPHRTLLNGEQVHRIYLNELGDIRQLPLWVGVLALTVVPKEAQAITDARNLASRARQEEPPAASRDIIEMITTIMSYQFETLSQETIGQMLDISIKDVRIYREARQEGRQEEASNLVSRQLKKRFPDLSEDIKATVSTLTTATLEELGEALLDFERVEDLQDWLIKKA